MTSETFRSDRFYRLSVFILSLLLAVRVLIVDIFYSDWLVDVGRQSVLAVMGLKEGIICHQTVVCRCADKDRVDVLAFVFEDQLCREGNGLHIAERYFDSQSVSAAAKRLAVW